MIETKKFKSFEEMMNYFGIKDKTIKENPVKKAIDLSKKINDTPTTPTKRSKTHEHKPNNNIRLQITIDCRIL